MSLQIADGSCPKLETTGCLEYRSLIAEHDVVMAEYELRSRMIEGRKFAHLLKLGEQLLQEGKDHAQVHGCAQKCPVELSLFPQLPERGPIFATSLDKDSLKRLFCKERSDLLERWVKNVSQMAATASVLALPRLSRARFVEAVQQSRSAMATCVQSAADYRTHTIEHGCSLHSPKPDKKVDVFPVFQGTPNSFSARHIGEQLCEQPHL